MLRIAHKRQRISSLVCVCSRAGTRQVLALEFVEGVGWYTLAEAFGELDDEVAVRGVETDRH
jgi:hypothetical protein